jgi:hypothetical protein
MLKRKKDNELENSVFNKDDFKMYTPQDINGKTLKITVLESEGITLISGTDIETGITYMLKEEFKKEGE